MTRLKKAAHISLKSAFSTKLTEEQTPSVNGWSNEYFANNHTSGIYMYLASNRILALNL
jgi:hypothetical protein